MTPKQISIILHLYQPSIQTATVFKQIYDTSYLPLLKILKNNKNANLTLNIPLSLLEIMDMYGYSNWLSDIAKLYETGKIELIGSAAYHPLLSQFNDKMCEDQIILNEYGLGYYFGKKIGFEGEKSIVLKDVSGFFPPELAVNEAVLRTISRLNYSWVLIDECAVENVVGPILTHQSGLDLAVRNTQLSNYIAFFRGFDPACALEQINNSMDSILILAMDGETFGHHNKEGILYLDTLLDSLVASGHSINKTSDLISSTRVARQTRQCDGIRPSCWGATRIDIEKGNILPFWRIDGNPLQTALWDLYMYVSQQYANLTEPECEIQNLENTPVWKNEVVETFENELLKKYIMTKMSYMRLVASDVAWWGSEKELLNKDVIFDACFINKYLDFASAVVSLTADTDLNALVQKVRKLI